MRTLYLDVISGISGDMFLGALIDLGVRREDVEAELGKLNLSGYHITAERTAQSAIWGTSFDVQLDHGQHKDAGFTEHTHHHDDDLPAHHHHDEAGHDHHAYAEHDHHHEAEPEHSHDHHDAAAHQHEHADAPHVHVHPHTTAAPHHHHDGARHYTEIVDLINGSTLSDYVKQHATAVFAEIAQAEARVHNVPIAEVHFHEVGAIDSIVDIVGGFIALEKLHVEAVTASPLVDGTGFITVAHGKMPIPVPAVMEMRAGTTIPVTTREDIHTELVTPTGMGIVKTLVKHFGPLPETAAVQKVGYGFGKRDIGQINALRVLLCEDAPLSQQNITATNDDVLELNANIDDQSPESLGPVLTLLLDGGAYDAFFTPIQMKNNRPAVKLTVLANPTDRDNITRLILRHTSTAGVRYQTLHRTIMRRTFRTVSTPYGDVRIKTLSYQDIVKEKPEYADCASIAKNHNLSLAEVYQVVYSAMK